MAQPTYVQWSNPQSAGVGLVSQITVERILSALASFVLQTNPDGTSF